MWIFLGGPIKIEYFLVFNVGKRVISSVFQQLQIFFFFFFFFLGGGGMLKIPDIFGGYFFFFFFGGGGGVQSRCLDPAYAGIGKISEFPHPLGI